MIERIIVDTEIEPDTPAGRVLAERYHIVLITWPDIPDAPPTIGVPFSVQTAVDRFVSESLPGIRSMTHDPR